MRTFLAGIFFVAAFFIVAANVYDGSNSRFAAALSNLQIESILDLLTAFNVDEKTVNEVRDALATSVSTTTSEGSMEDAGMATTTGPVTIEGGPPSCTLTSTHLTPLKFDNVTISWSSTNSTHVVFDPDTTGVKSAKDLPLPEGEHDPGGSVTFTADVDLRHTINMTAYGAEGETGTCTIVIDILASTAGGNYRGIINGELFIETADVRRSDALINCTQKANDNPDASILCTWNDDVILSQN